MAQQDQPLTIQALHASMRLPFQTGGDRAELVSVLSDAMFDDPGLTIEAVGRALEARGMHVDDLVGLWDEAQDEVDESTGF